MKPKINIEPEYPTRLQDLIDDLQNLDDADYKTALLAVDLAYRSGLLDGLRVLHLVEELH